MGYKYNMKNLYNYENTLIFLRETTPCDTIQSSNNCFNSIQGVSGETFTDEMVILVRSTFFLKFTQGRINIL